ncbi:BREX-1 system adenine-specific DNA-methyltransferase PglX [Lacticaseibacillus mingshuiensis]|uniref:site-specific DNA-methyltransferase (adenine-specific) n=1 Tax=Lacticaseibacillus mingshuiensis TaxID=2799574 RepID=A0ABW4CDR2_9LACO|nr:BREX-1 system adenine-specific DNA-methyltransferase PglX [Lacticaseibacillus mingshuiensis]
MDRLYQILFMKQIKILSKQLPQVFEPLDDYMQLLFVPSYHQGFIPELVRSIPEASFDLDNDDSHGQVQLIGWLYQYYNTDQKTKAIEQPKSHKFRGTEIASATQIFTPDWIVRYMLQNSVGKLWIKSLLAKGDSRSETEIAEHFQWQYYMPEAAQPDDVQLLIDVKDGQLSDLRPEQLTILDPSMGSGHMLVYAFDLLMQIYLDQGYSQRIAATNIIQNNLFGLDLDKRATQLASFSVMMKLRHYDRRALIKGNLPKLFTVNSFGDLTTDQLELAYPEVTEKQKNAFRSAITVFTNANVTGSLTEIGNLDIAPLAGLFELNQATIASGDLSERVGQLINICQILAKKYEVVVTNPPYMGSSRMDDTLANFAKKHYPNAKADLFAMFLEHFQESVVPGGYCAMVTMQSWMFLSSFESLRQTLLAKYTISNLMHMENNVMGIAFGTAVTITRNASLTNFIGTYHQIKTSDVASGKIPSHVPIAGNRYKRTNQANFEVIVEQPITYWFSERMVSAFRDFPALQEVAELKAGLSTGDNGIFQRRWQEVKDTNISFTTSTISETTSGDVRWYPCDTGGLFIKWSNRKEIVVDWQNNGEHIRNYTNRTGRMAGAARNTSYYFRPGISWNKLSSSRFGARYRTSGYVFDDTSRTMYPDASVSAKTILGFINSKVAFHFLQGLNPSMSFTNGDLKRLPVSVKSDNAIDTIVGTCIAAVEEGIDSYEESWQFTQFPFLKIAEHHRNWTVEAAFDAWRDEAQQRFDQLKANEEELNRIFIDLYGLQDELTPEVKDEDVSVRLADRGRDIRSFLSYFIGVTFGRYSIDTAGLAYAGGYWDSSKYKTVQPVEDDVVLLTDDDYFGDERDILVRFKKFMTTTFGVEHLSENIRYIADSLNTKGDTPEDQIRHYFCDDFFRDHLSTYQKRPIYWQLNAGKQGGFKALLYLHRYDENTMATIRTAYLHPLQDAYAQKQEYLSHLLETEKSSSERNSIGKRLTKLANQLDEITKFDQSLQHVANLHIDLDLDDGVVVNYEKVQGGEKLLTPLK